MGEKKFRVTISARKTVPSDFKFVSAEIVVWATDEDAAEDYADTFLDVYGIRVYAETDEVTELAS